MKTVIIILSLLVASCGKDDSGSADASETPQTNVQDDNIALLGITRNPMETDLYAFDLRGVKVHLYDVEAAPNSTFDYWDTDEGKKKSNFFKKMPDGSRKDCEVSVFIGIIQNAKNTGIDSGSLVFNTLDLTHDQCSLLFKQFYFKFVAGKVQLTPR